MPVVNQLSSFVNEDIANIFEEMSLLLEMGDIQFKPRAYEKAASSLRGFEEDVAVLHGRGGRKAVRDVPGIGEHMAAKIEEYIQTGHIKEYERLKEKYPIDLLSLSRIEGVGAHTIKELYKQLGIRTVADLEKAAVNHRISKIKHFGSKTEQNIVRGISFFKESGKRRILGYSMPFARTIEDRMRRVRGVSHLSIAGSLRRRKETIGDIDILVASEDPQEAIETFTSMPKVIAVYAKGPTKASVRFANGVQSDLRVVPEESFGAALQYFTGSKAHNIALRERAIKRGARLSEYGVFKGSDCIASRTEEDVYAALGLQYIPPELRENSGEIEAAEKDMLPKILPYGAVRGDLQVQSKWTDGSDSIEELANAAYALGREYIAITDHTRALAMTGGLDERKIAEQGREIGALNKKFSKKNFRILKGVEANVMRDGSIDIDDGTLAKLDVVGVSVHSLFKMSKEQMTKRIIVALKNPNVDILFHPTGRIIDRRPPYEVDMPAIIKAAVQYDVALEIDAYPERSDLNDAHVRQAIEAGVKIVIDTDAHATDHLRFMEYGEAIARRGWATKKDILNTLPVDRLLKYFQSNQVKKRENQSRA